MKLQVLHRATEMLISLHEHTMQVGSHLQSNLNIIVQFC